MPTTHVAPRKPQKVAFEDCPSSMRKITRVLCVSFNSDGAYMDFPTCFHAQFKALIWIFIALNTTSLPLDSHLVLDWNSETWQILKSYAVCSLLLSLPSMFSERKLLWACTHVRMYAATLSVSCSFSLSYSQDRLPPRTQEEKQFLILRCCTSLGLTFELLEVSLNNYWFSEMSPSRCSL